MERGDIQEEASHSQRTLLVRLIIIKQIAIYHGPLPDLELGLDRNSKASETPRGWLFRRNGQTARKHPVSVRR